MSKKQLKQVLKGSKPIHATTRGPSPAIGEVLDMEREIHQDGALRSTKVTFFINKKKGTVACDWCVEHKRRPTLRCSGRCRKTYCMHGVGYVGGKGFRCHKDR